MILSHLPAYVTALSPYVNIFGHAHINPIYSRISTHPMHVSSLVDYKPVSLQKVKQYMESELRGKRVLVIDDICRKGGTFYHAAQELNKVQDKGIDTSRIHIINVN